MNEPKREKTFQKYIFFSIYMESGALAWHLLKEGKDVTVAQVWDLKTVGEKKPESSETHSRRWGMWKGILHKQKAEDMIERLAKIPNKDDYFIVFDFNTLWSYAEKASKMGFRYGLFPTKFDYMLEADRNMAKQFVQSYYPDLKVAEVTEFKKIEDGIEMLEKSEEFWALKGNDPSATTVVPSTKMLEFAKDEIIDVLRNHKADYERKGFILERQIREGIEFCTQCVYQDGEHVAYSVDLENKALGPGNVGIKVGCAENLICAVPDNAPVLSKVFTEAMDKVAKKHKGLFYADANTILKDGELYFLEFCSNRMGFDAIQTECAMAGSVSNYFESLTNNEDPYKFKYGVAVRGLNMNKGDDGEPMPNIAMRWSPEHEDSVWPYDMHKDEKGKMVNGGFDWELLSVFTGASDDLEYAIIKAFETVENFSFDEMYHRSQGDFIDRTYPGNILDRFEAIQALISSPEVEGEY